MAYNAGSIKGVMRLDTAPWMRGLNVATVATTSSMNKMAAASKVATVAVTAAGIAAAASTVQAEKYRNALSDVAIVARGTGIDMAKASKALLTMDASFGSAIQQAGAFKTAITSGARKYQDAMDIVAQASMFATTHMVDQTTSVRLMTGVMNAYKNATGDAELTITKLGDALNETTILGNITGKQLASVLGRITPMYAEMNVPIQEVLGSLAELTKSGVTPFQSATQMLGIMNKMLKPTQELAKALDKVRLKTDEGNETFETAADVIGEHGLSGALKVLSTLSDGQAKKLAPLLGNIRAMSAGIKLAGSSYEGYLETTAKIFDSEKSLAKAFETKEKTLKTTKNLLTNTATILGEPVWGVFRGYLQNINEEWKSFNDYLVSDESQDRIYAFGESMINTFSNVELFIVKVKSAVKSLSSLYSSIPVPEWLSQGGSLEKFLINRLAGPGTPLGILRGKGLKQKSPLAPALQKAKSPLNNPEFKKVQEQVNRDLADGMGETLDNHQVAAEEIAKLLRKAILEKDDMEEVTKAIELKSFGAAKSFNEFVARLALSDEKKEELLTTALTGKSEAFIEELRGAAEVEKKRVEAIANMQLFRAMGKTGKDKDGKGGKQVNAELIFSPDLNSLKATTDTVVGLINKHMQAGVTKDGSKDEYFAKMFGLTKEGNKKYKEELDAGIAELKAKGQEVVDFFSGIATVGSAIIGGISTMAGLFFKAEMSEVDLALSVAEKKISKYQGELSALEGSIADKQAEIDRLSSELDPADDEKSLQDLRDELEDKLELAAENGMLVLEGMQEIKDGEYAIALASYEDQKSLIDQGLQDDVDAATLAVNVKEAEMTAKRDLLQAEIDAETLAAAEKKKLLDAETAEKEKQQKRMSDLQEKQFRAQKAMDIAGVWMSTAAGIASIWAALWWNPPAAGGLTAMLTGVGIAQTALINKQKFVPQYAKGTNYHGGGSAIVGEEGPEMIELPRGTGVRTASDTRRTMDAMTRGGGGDSYTLNFNNPTFDSKDRIDDVVDVVEKRLGERMGGRVA